ncbi:DUF4932 domain-containing protein [Pedobacter duraquae]|uniref:Uncharacterized protein DUF4932 n=1 Tax=Pedobacter duraquae TaxID=425511 RepID=A0A4R6ICS0_9SPHI|nr:DUF4932 domain-containing protein [Pedobacter duraquae]TDO20060.1 uncharacterized protein DUF4932 [Pedobacter duraquae]
MLKLKLTSILLFLSVLSFGQFKADVSVDPRVELLSITFRLAGNKEYNDNYAKSYVSDIHSWFDPFKADPLIEFATKIRQERGVSYDAVMSMAVNLKFNGAQFSLLKASENTLEKRWTSADANEFVTLLNAFYVKTNAKAFLLAHQDMYADAVGRMQEAFRDFDQSWYAKYYGTKPTEAYKIVIGMGNGGGNYGPSVSPQNEQKIVYAIMGCWRFDDNGKPLFETGRYLPTLIHEFNHSFVNRLLTVGNHEQKLEDSARKIYAAEADNMKDQAYAEWRTMVNESIVRASVVRYMIAHQAAKADIDREVQEQVNRGFLWTPGLVDLLGVYEQNRKKYPDFVSFYPQIISLFNKTATNIDGMKSEYVAKQPKVKSLAPFQNGAQNVDPSIKELVITFDKPLLGKGHSFNAGSLGGNAVPIKKLIGYEQENQTYKLGIELKPNTEYEFIVTGLSFKSVEGIPLQDYTIKFRTAAQ